MGKRKVPRSYILGRKWMLFIDLDGPLTIPKHASSQPAYPIVSDRAMDRLQELYKSGFAINIITSRPYDEVARGNLLPELKKNVACWTRLTFTL
jgi:hydroxymethylpyrimidine pyrophosphatase-like HAD family hydrolase